MPTCIISPLTSGVIVTVFVSFVFGIGIGAYAFFKWVRHEGDTLLLSFVDRGGALRNEYFKWVIGKPRQDNNDPEDVFHVEESTGLITGLFKDGNKTKLKRDEHVVIDGIDYESNVIINGFNLIMPEFHRKYQAVCKEKDELYNENRKLELDIKEKIQKVRKDFEQFKQDHAEVNRAGVAFKPRTK